MHVGKLKKKINKLEIDKKLRESLINILINTDTEEFSSLEEEYKDDNSIYQIEKDITSEELEASDDEMCLGPQLSYFDCKIIIVLTKEQTSILISVIDRLEDSPLKNEFLQ
ncbi:hypothetical protein CR513_23181, partial [Mucuna pruriens]